MFLFFKINLKNILDIVKNVLQLEKIISEIPINKLKKHFEDKQSISSLNFKEILFFQLILILEEIISIYNKINSSDPTIKSFTQFYFLENFLSKNHFKKKYEIETSELNEILNHEFFKILGNHNLGEILKINGN